MRPAAGETAVAPAVRGPTLAVVFLAALALRPQLVGVGPLLDVIRRDLGVSFTWVGSLTTIPLLCMGVFAPFTPSVVRRLGLGRTLTTSLAAVAIAGGVRAVVATPVLLLGTTVLIGIAIAVAGTALPMVVGSAFRSRPAAATGMSVAGIQLGAAGATLTAVPLTAVTGSWRGALAVFAAAAAISTVSWATAAGRPTVERTAPPPEVGARRRLLRRAVVWVVAAAFALQSIIFYGLVTWLPALLVEAGWSPSRAGAALATLNVAGLGTSLTLPRLADRRGSRRAYLLVGVALAAVATTGLLAAPAAAWLWAVLAGVGLALLFALTLTLPLDVADSTDDVGTATGVVLGIGFGVAALAPMLLGALRDITGSFAVSMSALLGVLGVMGLVSAWLTPARLAARPGTPVAVGPDA